MTKLSVVGARVDALTVAFRVALDEELVAALEARANVAREHGRASFAFRTLRGELAHSRASRTWHVTNEAAGWRVMVDCKASGAIDLPNGERLPGWTVEVVWYAQVLADLPHVGVAVERARVLAEGLGSVLDARVRRVDICADVAGASVLPEDVDRLVRRARAKVTAHGVEREIEGPLFAGTTSHHANKRQISGISVCPGGALMARLYDKRRELAQQPEGKRLAEESRWKDRGWDGEAPVLRVEFQIRGTAVKELGIRDPSAPHDAATGVLFKGERLEHRIDPIWQKCLEWTRLVVPGTPRPGKRYAHADRLSDCADDPIWGLLRRVRFLEGSALRVATRRRIRGGASSAQALGCVLSILGHEGELVTMPEESGTRLGATEEVIESFEIEVIQAFVRAGQHAARDLARKWGADKAIAHFGIANNAVMARLAAAREWEARAMASAVA